MSRRAAPAKTPAPDGLIDVRLTAIRYAARDTNLYEFTALDGKPLPTYEPGAHIDLHLPNGLIRQYSLIKAEPRSLELHRRGQARPGEPRRLALRARRAARRQDAQDQRAAQQFRAGGERQPRHPACRRHRHHADLVHGAAAGAARPLLEALLCLPLALRHGFSAVARGDGPAQFHFDDESAGNFLDVTAIVAAAPKDAHLYCCGPTPMLNAFEAATASWPREQVHIEYFTPKQDAAKTGGFVVELARSGQEFVIPEGNTILQVLLDAGVDVDYSCELGICGACEQRVISGEPEHRDAILTEEEQASNTKVMICCAGCKSERLVLDL